MAKYMTELVYVNPEPVVVVDSQRRHQDPLDVQIQAPIYDMRDVGRIKDAVGVEGVYNVICDIPAKTITVTTSLSPRAVVNLVRSAMGSTAQIINIVDSRRSTQYPAARDRSRYSSYDDMYSYQGRSSSSSSSYSAPYNGRSSSYSAPYNGRSYDNEFRPSSYDSRPSQYYNNGRGYH